MLMVLKIRNLALVEDLVWELGPGLVGVTGETGAGKSVIVGALKLVLGERGDKGLIRTGEDKCVIEAVFEPNHLDVINACLEDAGLDACEDGTLLVKREISRNGSGKQYVNCSPATQGVLRMLGENLVDLHGPHEHQSLLSNDRQLQMLDAFGAYDKELDQYASDYQSWKTLKDEFEKLSGAERETVQEIDLLRYQVNEIESANFSEIDEADLLSRYQISSSAQKLLEYSNDAVAKLEESSVGVLDQLQEVEKVLRDIESYDKTSTSLMESFREAHLGLREVTQELRDYQEKVDINPEEAEICEEQVNLLESLKRKYGSSLEEVVAFGVKARTRLELIENRGDHLEELSSQVEKTYEKLEKSGKALAKCRNKSAPQLSETIVSHLEDLGFRQCHFELELVANYQPQKNGFESVEFMFSPNPGEPLKPLKLVASSGEMSRVMLAVKSALAKEDKIPLLVFDEIDANVGGEIAIAVGSKMASLGKNHQVIAITHLPQVAALAQSHYVVEKKVEEGRTKSVLRTVDQKLRRVELARMLGGESDSALAHADTLLGSV